MAECNMYDIICKKRDGLALSQQEIQFWIKNYVADIIPDYQSAALLMAIFIQGLSEEETNYLTEAMLHSGEVLDLSEIPGIKVDKHSSGGVGDKTSLVVAPIAAAAGLKVAKMSGRGLGHTGGTLDKLEAIPGFQVALSKEEFLQQVNKYGIAIISQTAELVPADQKLYALRDVTATVNQIPLIASSIMSKKLATGADVIVLDVKYGKGAFMPTPEEAVKLAQAMINIGQYHQKTVSAIISSMESPLGYAVGNALEVDEAINTLAEKGPADLEMLAIALAGEMIYQSKLKKSRQEACRYAERLLNHGKAWKSFLTLVKAQHGSVEAVKNGPLTHAPYKIKMGAPRTGFITSIDALAVGNAARDLGAGRYVKTDTLDLHAGIVLAKKVGEKVEEGECLATIYAADIVKATEVGTHLLQAIEIGDHAVGVPPLIYGIVDKDGLQPYMA